MTMFCIKNLFESLIIIELNDPINNYCNMQLIFLICHYINVEVNLLINSIHQNIFYNEMIFKRGIELLCVQRENLIFYLHVLCETISHMVDVSNFPFIKKEEILYNMSFKLIDEIMLCFIQFFNSLQKIPLKNINMFKHIIVCGMKLLEKYINAIPLEHFLKVKDIIISVVRFLNDDEILELLIPILKLYSHKNVEIS